MRRKTERKFVTDDAAVVWLAQHVKPTLMPEYLMWAAVWRKDPSNGRGVLSQPLYGSLERGAGLFWDVIDKPEALVQCYLARGVREQLQLRYEAKR